MWVYSTDQSHYSAWTYACYPSWRSPRRTRSQPTVISYLSIFDNFWNQLELYQKLKQHDKMQQEFINIAAHELRTPAQSILGYAELAKTEPQIEKQALSYIDGMYRNAYRI